jgi:hypothetical protein
MSRSRVHRRLKPPRASYGYLCVVIGQPERCRQRAAFGIGVTALLDHKPPEAPARHSQQFPGFLGRQPATTVLLKPIFKTRHKRLP